MDDSYSVSLTSRRRRRRDDCPLDVRLGDGVAVAAAAQVRLAARRGHEGAVRRVQLLAVGRHRHRLLIPLLLSGELKLELVNMHWSRVSSYPCTTREITQPHQSPKPK